MSVVIYDPTAADAKSSVRGIGRYLQLLRENLPNATFTGTLPTESSSMFVLPFFNPTQPPIVTKKLGKKQIAVIHDLIPLKYPNDFPIGLRGKLNMFRNKQTLTLYDTIVTDSEVTKADIIKILGVPEKKIHIIYPCLPDSLLNGNPKKIASPDIPYFVYAGDATPNKNLVKIARSIQAADVTCYFAGKVFVQTEHSNNPWNKELNEFMNIAKDDPRFIFPGYVSDDELLGLYKGAIANILLSKDEGFGFSFLEAAQCKTPSLLSDVPIFHETAADSALFTSLTDIEQIATSLKLLATEKALMKELAEKAYKRRSFFSADKFKMSWEEILS